MYLYSQGITSFDAKYFNGYKNLEYLDISYNLLANLPSDLLSGLSELTAIYLSSNKLTSLPAGIFNGLTNLEVIALDLNGLKYLDENLLLNLDNLMELWLEFNEKQKCERVFEVKDISVLPNKLLEALLLEEKYLTNAEENIKANDRN